MSRRGGNHRGVRARGQRWKVGVDGESQRRFASPQIKSASVSVEVTGGWRASLKRPSLEREWLRMGCLGNES